MDGYARPVPRFLCIRHAESTMNAEGRWQGQVDAPLSERGVGQARALAGRLSRAPAPAAGYARLLCSDLLRAQQTAEPIAAALGLAVEVDKRLREADAGCWSGLLHSEIKARWPQELARYRSGDEHARAGGGGENRHEVRARVRPVLEELAHAHPGGGDTILIVTHSGVLRTIRPGLPIANAEVHTFDLADIGRAWSTT